MITRRLVIVGAALMSAVLFAQTPPPTSPPQTPAQQPQVTYRTRTTLVPIDVRVIDKDGKPVTDLTQEDFTVYENNALQKISHFSAQALVPQQVSATDLKAGLSREADDELKPQTRRIFLIVLGRGRLQPPSKGVDAMLGMLRTRLLPQDQVAVMAYNRATDFTADHDRIIPIVERFKKLHEGIESKLANYFSGLRAVY